MKAFRLKRPEPREADILSSILRALKIHPAVAWFSRMNTGSGELRRASGGASQYIRFGFKGCPDIIGQLSDGRFLGIEVKRPSGRVSEDQQAFIAKATKNHGVAFVARSVDDVFRVLDRI